MAPKSDLHRDYVIELENELREFEKKEDAVTKRMQLLVYPSMVAFFILAAYGFYLIQSLTTDVNRMSNTMEAISESMTQNMGMLSTTTAQMSTQMGSMVKSTASMTEIMSSLSDTTKYMATSTNNMQKDMSSLNQNISTPLSMFNKFIPWNNNSNGRFPSSTSFTVQNDNPPPYYQATPTNFVSPKTGIAN